MRTRGRENGQAQTQIPFGNDKQGTQSAFGNDKQKAWFGLGLAVVLLATHSARAQQKQLGCVRAVVEGEVRAGQGFERVFAPGLKFLLEPIASGWIVRVLDARGPREEHDYAELATPPYRSVTPLAIGTDFSFRSQDALGWNPRRFRYAADAAVFGRLKALYVPATNGDAKAASALAEVVSQQPEVELRMVDARMVAGTGDQARMAAAVASHLETTPHTLESGAASRLGRITWMKFRAAFDLVPGTRVGEGAVGERVACRSYPIVGGQTANSRTTRLPAAASEQVNPGKK